MSEPNNIDMFKNDVRYRDNIAHVETIPAKKASFKKVDNLNEKIIGYLKSKDMKKFIEYGYLFAIPNIEFEKDFKLNFRDGVEKLAGLSSYSKLYEYSSEIAHSSPLMIYSNEKKLSHLTLSALYEVFFRIEVIFTSHYLNAVSDEFVKKSYITMRNLYYSQLKEMASWDEVDIIAHLDLLMKFNDDQHYISFEAFL